MRQRHRCSQAFVGIVQQDRAQKQYDSVPDVRFRAPFMMAAQLDGQLPVLHQHLHVMSDLLVTRCRSSPTRQEVGNDWLIIQVGSKMHALRPLLM